MLFNTDYLNKEYNSRNTLNLLESMYCIDRVWSRHTPASIPLMESKEYGAYMARYSDLLKLSEEYDASIQECLDAVIYENHLKPNEVIVSLEEWRPYVDPLILHRFSNNYVLIPEINTPAYRLCEVCMESFLETGDYIWLDIFLETDVASAQIAFDKVQRAKKYYNEVLEKMKTLSQSSSEYKQLQQRLDAAAQTIKKQEAIAAMAQSTGLTQQSSPEEIERRRRIAGSAFNDKYEGDLNYAKRQYELAMKRATKAEARFKKKGLTTSAQYENQLKQAEYWDKQLKRNQQTLNNTVGDSEQGQKEKEEALAQVKKDRISQKLEERKKARMQQGQEVEKTGVHQPNTTDQQGESQSKSWLAQKWAALKNWWNNAGQADDKGNIGWFSNLVGKFKNAIGLGKPVEIKTDPKTAAQMAGDALDKSVNSMQAQTAQKAENTEKQAEETAKKQAENNVQQAQNDQKQAQEQEEAKKKQAEQQAAATPTQTQPTSPPAAGGT